MPALAADWGNGDCSVGGYSESMPTHNRYNFFSSDEDTTPTKASTSVLKNGHGLKNGITYNGIVDEIPAPKTCLFDKSKLHLQWTERHPAGAGLSNLGNTCFLNSVLQCLAYTAPLAHYLIYEGHKKSCKQRESFCMLCALQDHLLKCSTMRGQAIKPLQILQNLRNIAKCLTWGQQEDAHEFLRYVVDSMQRSCLAGTNGLDKYSKETTFVHQVFGGYLRSQVKCLKCHHPSNTYDPFLDISVDIQDAFSLEQALAKFVQPETLDIENAYKCERCKVKVSAQKRFTIHRTSNVLTVHLKRFDMNRMLGAKVSRHIKFPMVLNIRPYMSKTKDEPVNYTLYGVLVHSGYSCNSGHYYCYVRAPNNQWYCMNDSSVTQCSLSTVLDAEAYMLFYIKTKGSSKMSNGSAPHTITKSEMMNGSGDHLTPQRRVVGCQPPPASSSTVRPVVNPFAIKNNKTPQIVLHTKSGEKLYNGLIPKVVIKQLQVNNKPKTITPSGVPSLVAYSDPTSEDEQSDSENHSVNQSSDPVSKPSKLSLVEYTARQGKKTPEKQSNGGVVRSSTEALRFTPRTIKTGPMPTTSSKQQAPVPQTPVSNGVATVEDQTELYGPQPLPKVNGTEEAKDINITNSQVDKTNHSSSDGANHSSVDQHSIDSLNSTPHLKGSKTSPSNSPHHTSNGIRNHDSNHKQCNGGSSRSSIDQRYNHSKGSRHSSRSPKRRTPSPTRYRRYSRSPQRRSYRRRSNSPDHRRRSRSPRDRRRSPDNRSRRSRSRSRSRNGRCFGSYRQRHRQSRHRSRSHSPHDSRRGRSRSPSYDGRRGSDRRTELKERYRHTYGHKNRDRQNGSSKHNGSRAGSSERKQEANSESKSIARKRRSSSSGSDSDYKKRRYSAHKTDIKKPLIGNDHDEDEYQWAEITKDNLTNGTSAKHKESNGKTQKSRTTWYDNGTPEKDPLQADKKTHKPFQKLTNFAAKYMSKH